MKRLFLLIYYACHFLTAGAQRSMIELRTIVEEADSLSSKAQKIFYLYKIGPKNTSQKETWYYTLKNGLPVVFEIRYYRDSTELTEVYYVQNGKLICTEEYETLYRTSNEDHIAYGNIKYYDNTLVRQVVTMGKSKNQSLNENRGYDVFARFRKRFAELKQNIY